MPNTQSSLLPPDETKSLDQIVENACNDVFTACQLHIIHDGKTVFDASWGWIDPDNNRYAVTATSFFDFASVTKLFVETTFLALVSSNKIQLDDPVVSVLPEFGNTARPIVGGKDPHTNTPLPLAEHFVGKTVDPAMVTFRHLITHKSGLAPWTDVYNAVGDPPPLPTQTDSVGRVERWQIGLATLYDAPFVDHVGENVHYSDLGLLLIGAAIERLTGTSLDVAVQTHVTAPLNLQHTTYNPMQNGIPRENIVPTEIDRRWRNRRVWGEVHDENACGVGGIAGHAGLFGTARDVAAFGEAWRTRDSRLGIDSALMDEATTGERYGLGWRIHTGDDSPAGDVFSLASYGHTGFTGTSLWIDPERELVVALMTNRVYMGREKPGIHAFRRQMHDTIADFFDSP